MKFAVEIDSHARATYTANFIKRKRNPPVLSEEIDFTKVNWRGALKDANLRAGECTLVMGGPPCQGFSGHRNGGPGDPRNELLLRYFDAVSVIKPEAFILENVPGLLWSDHADYRERFYAVAERTGYAVLEPTVLNARDFGVPQNRKRVFIVGFRGDIPREFVWPPVPTHYAPDSLEVGLKLGAPWVPARHVFEEAISADDPNAVHMKHTEELVRVFKSTPVNGGRSDSMRTLPCHSDHTGHKDVYGRIREDQPGPTMTTGCVNPSKGRFVHPTEHHGITVRHAARFQSFPDTFVFMGGLMAAGRQIGNAVPVKLGEVLIVSVLKAIGFS